MNRFKKRYIACLCLVVLSWLGFVELKSEKYLSGNFDGEPLWIFASHPVLRIKDDKVELVFGDRTNMVGNIENRSGNPVLSGDFGVYLIVPSAFGYGFTMINTTNDSQRWLFRRVMPWDGLFQEWN